MSKVCVRTEECAKEAAFQPYGIKGLLLRSNERFSPLKNAAEAAEPHPSSQLDDSILCCNVKTWKPADTQGNCYVTLPEYHVRHVTSL